MLDSSGSDLAYVAEPEEDEDEALPVSEEDDYDVYDAPNPIRSNRDAWLGIAGALGLTILIAWAMYAFLEAPSNTTAGPLPMATMGDMTPRAGEPLYVNTVPPTPRAITVRVVQPGAVGERTTSSEDRPGLPDYLAAYTDGTSVSAAYGEFVLGDFLVINSVTSAQLAYPDQEITVLLDHLQADDPTLTDFQVVYAGPGGGVARCGSGNFTDLTKVVCVWAAEQSVGVVTWIDQPLGSAKAEFLAVRTLIEQPV